MTGERSEKDRTDRKKERKRRREGLAENRNIK